MAYIYYNQRSYANVPYPRPSDGNANVKGGGCGVCACLMALENNTSHRMSVAELAQLSINCGARDDYGTNTSVLIDALGAKLGGFVCALTDSIGELVAHLKTGGGAIANVGGDRQGYKGIFCSTGHFVYVAGMVDNQVIVLDPDQYDGKYNGWRSQHVTVRGNELQCDPVRLNEDCSNRSPRYWLISGTKATATPPPAPQTHYTYAIGDVVTVSSYYTSSTEQDSNKAVVPNRQKTATITDIAEGTRNPYLLDNGAIGWCNDGDIRERGAVQQERCGTVNTLFKPLNLRQVPNGAIIGSIPKGASVKILGESNGFYKVQYKNLTGYASGNYIK